MSEPVLVRGDYGLWGRKLVGGLVILLAIILAVIGKLSPIHAGLFFACELGLLL